MAAENRTVVKGYVRTREGQLHFRRVSGRHPPIVLLHRTPSSSASFENMLAIFAGVRAAIALDTPGFGGSFRPAGRPDTVAYARWFLDAIDALEIDQFHICAHHTGTHFAVEMAVLAPHRVRSLLLNGVLCLDAENRSKMLADIGPAKRVDRNGVYLAETWEKMVKLFPQFDADLVHAETIGALDSMDGRDQSFAAIFGQDFEQVLAHVRCPVAVAQADDDPLNPMLNRIRGRHPALSITKIGRAYLAAPELQPHSFSEAALRFAAAHDTPQEPMPMTDKRFKLVRSSDGYDLVQTAAERPQPGAGEVLVRMHAVALNRRDISVRDLGYPVFGADHFTPLSDGAGTIVAVGEGVADFAVGDRVSSTFFQEWQDGRPTLPVMMSALGAGGQGVFADHVIFSQNGIAKIPAHWSFEEAASIVCSGVTAWSALMTLGNCQKGDWVLIIGTGGVAIYALQIAVAAGARVVMLSSSDEKLARAQAMGAKIIINYRTTPDWADTVKKATDGGVHHAIELGGAGTLERSLASMAIGGHLALVGALDGFGGEMAASNLMLSALKVSAVLVGSRNDHLALTQFVEAHDIRPVIDSMFDVSEAEDAYAKAASGVFGKVVITMR